MKNVFLGVTAFAAALILTLGAVFSASAQEISSPVGAKHVVLIGYDGLGGNYIHWDELPNLSRFKEKGAWTQKMRSVIPSSSAINWASILMGAPSELHGFRTWGSKEPDLPSAVLTENGLFPDIFYLTRKAMPDSTLNCVYTWGGIGFLFDNKVMNDVLHAQSADEVCSKGLDYLAQNPTLTFIYFSGPDGAGHDKGWGTPKYYEVIRQQDVLLGKLLDYLEENDRMKDTVVLFVSDHGGTGNGHGGESMDEMETPFLALGCGVKPGEITDVVADYDVAATIAWILGLEEPQCWRGKPVFSAFGK